MNGYELHNYKQLVLQQIMATNYYCNKYWLLETSSIGRNIKILLFFLERDHHNNIYTNKS